MEAIPRISRAQSMDALSSQSDVAGYEAVALAGEEGAEPAIVLDFEDEIVSGSCVAPDGEIVHPDAKAAAEAGGTAP